jgi:hypothetical protein
MFSVHVFEMNTRGCSGLFQVDCLSELMGSLVFVVNKS